jgi:flagellin-like protein
MRKLLRSKKALSPVVAAIILIAVTVAVSIAVAAWMGALTFTFMKTDQFNVATVNFYGTSGSGSNYINVTIQNTGTSSFTISTAAKVNGVTYTATANGADMTISATAGSNSKVIKIQSVGWSNGAQYNIELQTTSGTKITYVANAPGT